MTKVFVFIRGSVTTESPETMKLTPTPKPTDAELAILRVLWQRGPSTVREVHEHLGQETRPTTTLKFIQIMTEKGLLLREGKGRPHSFRAAISESKTLRQLTAHLLDRAFGGSAPKMVMHILSAKKASAEELAEIRRMLDNLEGGEP
jgi:predicted transcriptional regulator